MQFKDLEWQCDGTDVIFAKPNNLRWGYYIYITELGFELNLLDDNFNHNELYQQNYNNLDEAKLNAAKHYTRVLYEFCPNN